MEIVDTLKKIVWVDVFRPIESDQAEAWLGPSPSKDLVDQLYAFGSLMLTEIGSRTTALDSKASSVMGWSLAILAGLLAGSPVWIDTNSWVVVLGVVGALVGSMASAALAGFAMRLQAWNWPSEEDWFERQLFTEPLRLKTYHILAMLESHRVNSQNNLHKGRLLRAAQFVLSMAALIVGLSATGRVASLFVSGVILP